MQIIYKRVHAEKNVHKTKKIGGKGITTKANDVSGIARLSLKIKEEEKNLQDAIKKLGEQMYENHLDEATKFFPELMYSIKMTQGEIARCKKEIAIYKGLQICPNCGSEQEKTVLFCTACGINMEEAARLEKPEKKVRFCKACGKELADESKFCMNCGEKVE